MIKIIRNILVVTLIFGTSFSLAYAAGQGNNSAKGQNQGNGQMPSNGQMQMMQNGGQGMDNSNRPAVVGEVTDIDGDILTVESTRFIYRENNSDNSDNSDDSESTTYTVDASDATVYDNGEEISLSDIEVGDHVMVQGEVNDDDEVIATRIHVGDYDMTGPANTTQERATNTNQERVGFFGRVGNFFSRIFGSRNK